MLIPLYWILGYLGCVLFTMLIYPPIVWTLDNHLKSGTYKEMWDYTYTVDSEHPALVFLLWPIFIFLLFAFFIYCGSLNTGITLSDRVYRCDCGYQFDRDIHAAKNVKLFGSTKRAECLEQASVETLASVALLLEQ